MMLVKYFGETWSLNVKIDKIIFCNLQNNVPNHKVKITNNNETLFVEIRLIKFISNFKNIL